MEIYQSGEAVTGFVSNKALALFCYLAATGRTHPRTLLQALLWGESPQNDAVNSLRNVLSNLRKLAGGHLLITRQTAAFNPDLPIWLDMAHFLAAAQGRQRPDGRLAPDDVLALETAVAAAGWDNLLAMMGSLHRFYEAQTWYQEGCDLFQQAIDRLADQAGAHPLAWGRLLCHTAGLLFRQGQIEPGKKLAEDSLQILQKQADPAALALAYNTLGIFQIHSGEFAAAMKTLRAAIDLYRQLGNRAEMVRPLANLGSACSRQGQYADGLAALQEGLATCREIGDRRGEALFLNNIAANYLMQDQPEAARPYLETCLPICDEIEFDQVKQVALYNLGEIYLGQQLYTQSIDVSQAAAAIARRLNDRMSLARALKIVGVAQTCLGMYGPAWEALKEGLAVAEATNGLPTVMDVLDGIAAYFWARNQRREAGELLHLLATHPAAESQYRDRARAKLAELGETAVASRPPDELARWLLDGSPGSQV